MSTTPLPTTINEALAWMDAHLHEERDEILKAEPYSLHHGLGQSLRNELGLWHGSPLAQVLRAEGHVHPDDMSHHLITTYMDWLRTPRPLPGAPDYVPPSIPARKTAHDLLEDE